MAFCGGAAYWPGSQVSRQTIMSLLALGGAEPPLAGGKDSAILRRYGTNYHFTYFARATLELRYLVAT